MGCCPTDMSLCCDARCSLKLGAGLVTLCLPLLVPERCIEVRTVKRQLLTDGTASTYSLPQGPIHSHGTQHRIHGSSTSRML